MKNENTPATKQKVSREKIGNTPDRLDHRWHTNTNNEIVEPNRSSRQCATPFAREALGKSLKGRSQARVKYDAPKTKMKTDAIATSPHAAVGDNVGVDGNQRRHHGVGITMRTVPYRARGLLDQAFIRKMLDTLRGIGQR